MTEVITIPKLSHEGSIWEDYPVIGQPGWIEVTDQKGNPQKPLVRCNCGHISGIGLHHVYEDGTVKASFWHKKGNVYPEDPNGCEWHVWIRLADWHGGDIPPDKDL